MAARGAQVVIADIGAELDGSGTLAGPAHEVVEEIKGAGGDAVACVASVAEEAGAAVIIETALNAFGRIDVVVNNAGISNKHRFEELSTDQFRRMIDVHYFGTLFTTKAAWPHFLAAGYGRVVNTTSEAILGEIPDLTSYGSAKGAIWGLTKNLAIEATGRGIRVNAVAPRGNTRMAQDGKSKLGAGLGIDPQVLDKVLAQIRPELVSPAVAFLAHESCSLNGEVLQVGGGLVSRLAVFQTQGLNRPDLTPEDIAANLGTILDPTNAEVRDVKPFSPA
jgi:NAD(P)-dependent dehydrogenase (short-subunit alcohol dehydrogenase family)